MTKCPNCGKTVLPGTKHFCQRGKLKIAVIVPSGSNQAIGEALGTFPGPDGTDPLLQAYEALAKKFAPIVERPSFLDPHGRAVEPPSHSDSHCGHAESDSSCSDCSSSDGGGGGGD